MEKKLRRKQLGKSALLRNGGLRGAKGGFVYKGDGIAIHRRLEKKKGLNPDF